MSAPDTVLAKQKRRQWGPLLGLTLLVGVVLVFFLWFIGRATDGDSTLDGGPAATNVAPADETTQAPAATSPAPESGLPGD